MLNKFFIELLSEMKYIYIKENYIFCFEGELTMNGITELLEVMIPIIAIAGGIIVVIVSIILKNKIAVEKIRADALIKAEEIKAQNQLEIEKLMLKESEKDKKIISEKSGYDDELTLKKTKNSIRE